MKWSLGQKVTVKRRLTQSDFQRFADLSGANNPIHIDPEFSAQSKFGRTVAHGMLLYSCVAGVLGGHLPGAGSWQTYQEMMFTSPTYTEEIIIEVEIAQVDPETGAIGLVTRTIRSDGKPGLQGEAWVDPPGKSRPISKPGAQTEAAIVREAGDSFKGFRIGQQAELRRVFSPQDLIEYADLARDPNPWVVDAKFSQKNGLKDQVVPGGLIGGYFPPFWAPGCRAWGPTISNKRWFFWPPDIREKI